MFLNIYQNCPKMGPPKKDNFSLFAKHRLLTKQVVATPDFVVFSLFFVFVLHLALNPPHLFWFVFRGGVVFLFLEGKNCFPPRRGDFCLFFSISLCFSLPFSPPPFHNIFLCLSLSLSLVLLPFKELLSGPNLFFLTLFVKNTIK